MQPVIRTLVGLIAGALLTCGPALGEQVTIAYIGGTADVGFYIADARGYLKDEGIDAKFIVFDSSARMVAPLSTGEIDVASGAINAATYNAFGRGIKVRAVLDKARNKGVYSYQALVVRKDLWDSGVRSLKDLKGRKVVTTANGGNESAVIEEALNKEGLKSSDLEMSLLSMPQQVAAYASKSLDASILPEPFLSAAIRQGTVEKMYNMSDLREDDVSGVIVYGEKFIESRRDVALKVTKAYIRGLRDYVDALKGARLAGPGADAIIDILANYSTIKDKQVLRSIVPHYVDPNGVLGMESLRKDWTYFKAQGLVPPDVTPDTIVDTSFVDWAVKELGPYKPRAD